MGSRTAAMRELHFRHSEAPEAPEEGAATEALSDRDDAANLADGVGRLVTALFGLTLLGFGVSAALGYVKPRALGVGPAPEPIRSGWQLDPEAARTRAIQALQPAPEAPATIEPIVAPAPTPAPVVTPTIERTETLDSDNPY